MLCHDVRVAVDKACEAICSHHDDNISAADCLIASFTELRDAEEELAKA